MISSSWSGSNGFKLKVVYFFMTSYRKYESHKSYVRRQCKICSKIVAILFSLYFLCVCLCFFCCSCCCSYFYWSRLFQHKLHMFTFFSFGYNDLINFQVLTFQAFSMWRFWSNDPFYTQLFYYFFNHEMNAHEKLWERKKRWLNDFVDRWHSVNFLSLELYRLL